MNDQHELVLSLKKKKNLSAHGRLFDEKNPHRLPRPTCYSTQLTDNKDVKVERVEVGLEEKRGKMIHNSTDRFNY